MKDLKSKVPPSLFLVVGIIAVSFSAIFIKWSSAPTSVLGMYRLLFTAALMLPFLPRHMKELTSLQVRQWGMLILSGLFLALHFLLWMGSLKFTTVASSTILMSLEPVFVMIGAFWLFRERVNASGLVSISVAIAGTILIGWGDIGISKTALFGDMLSVFGTMAVAVHLLAGQKLRLGMSSFVYSMLVFVIAGGMFAIYNVIAGIPMTGYPLNEWRIFLLLAVVPTVFGHLLFNWLLKYVNATTISMSILGEPVGASILAVFMLNESLSMFQIVGGTMSIIGMSVFLKRSHGLHSDTHPVSQAQVKT